MSPPREKALFIYLNDAEGHHAKLAASQGISPDSRARITSIDPHGAEGGWPLHEVTQAGSAVEIDLMAAGSEPVTSAFHPANQTL